MVRAKIKKRVDRSIATKGFEKFLFYLVQFTWGLPVNAISGVIKTPYKIDNEACVRCGQCIENCRFGAIEILSGEGEE